MNPRLLAAAMGMALSDYPVTRHQYHDYSVSCDEYLPLPFTNTFMEPPATPRYGWSGFGTPTRPSYQIPVTERTSELALKLKAASARAEAETIARARAKQERKAARK